MKRSLRRFSQNSQRGSLGSPAPEDARLPLGELTLALDQLEERLRHLRTGLLNLTQLQQIQEQLTAPPEQLTGLTEEVQHLQRRADELEMALTKQFFSWEALREPFWQAVRFGGLGLVVGWFLRAWVMG